MPHLRWFGRVPARNSRHPIRNTGLSPKQCQEAVQFAAKSNSAADQGALFVPIRRKLDSQGQGWCKCKLMWYMMASNDHRDAIVRQASTLTMKPISTSQTPGHKFRYHAFISYSHAADGRLAPALQTGLQRLARPWYRLRAMRVFRDETGLAVTPELWGSIERALAESEYFLLLASPLAAQSKWVEQEVDWWLRHRSARSLLVVLTDGELVWESARSDFDWAKTTALPRRLENAFPKEPLHVDFRWARTNTDLSLRRPMFADAVARLAATLRGITLDELIGEDVRQHQRTMRLARSSVVALLVLTASAVLTAFVAIQAKRMVEPLVQKAQAGVVLQANEAKSRRLASVALNQQASDLELAILLAAEAVRLHESAAAVSALRQSLAVSVDPVVTLRGQGTSAAGAVFSPDGTQALTWGNETPQLCGAATGEVLRELRGHTGSVRQACFSKDGRRIVTAGGDDTARLWDASSGRSVIQLPHPGVTAALLSSDDSRVLTLAMGIDAILWDAATGAQIAELEYSDTIAFGDQVRDACFHPDGSRLAVCRRLGPGVFDAKTGKKQVELNGHTRVVRSVAFSPDGEWLVTASEDGAVRRWRAATGLCQAVLTHDAELNDAQFSPDGKWIMARDRNQLLVVWEADTGKRAAQIEMLPKPEHPVLFTFSPDGQCLLAASFDAQTAGLWETATGLRLGELTGEEGEIRTLHFSPDGRRALVGSVFAPARIFATAVCGSARDLLGLAGGRVSRQLTNEERQKYLAAP